MFVRRLRRQVAVANGKLTILREGKSHKFLEQVEHITFSGLYAKEQKQPALYVTERCVFRLSPEGVELIEVAPGIDIDRDILAHMDLRPVAKNLTLMDARIFRPEAIGLERELTGLSIAETDHVHPSRNVRGALP
jgi:propionate CoA-transferase